MSDSWSEQFDCESRVRADLLGYQRVFNKKSTRNWGRQDAPAPTLNVVPAIGKSCGGIAFLFPDARREEVSAWLLKREGKGFALCEVDVQFTGGETERAVTAIYGGSSVFPTLTAAELALHAAKAAGTHGTGREYVERCYQELERLGIEDAVVSDFWNAVRAQP